jgi:hypothetical protein
LADETDGIGLRGFIRSTEEKLGSTPWPNGIQILEITAQVIHRPLRAGIREKWLQFRRYVRDTTTIVPQQVKQIVSVLVLAANMEGQRLEHHERSRAAKPNIPFGSFVAR